MGTLRELFTKISRSNSKSSFDYQLYKYEDIQSEWIIHQGYLQYLYNTTILGDSIFKSYRAVLARIPSDNMEDLIGLYLYLNEKKSLPNFFPIDRTIKINERCDRHIRPEPKCYLFELNFIDKEKPEIFGAKDNSERQTWVKNLKNIFSKSTSASESEYLIPKPDETKAAKPLPSDPGRFYPSFQPDYVQHDNNVKDDKHRSLTDSKLSPYSMVEPIDYSDKSRGNSLPAVPSPLNDDSYVSNEERFKWDEIFYTNEKDDYKGILVKTGESGAFLIRPQSKKTSSSDHDFTLCMYHESNNIRCFAIHHSPSGKNEYSLLKNGVSFVDMVQLCEYYTTNSLPMSIKNVYLKKPYKSYYIE